MNNNTNINIQMKQFLLKGMAIRLLALLVAFFMIASMDGMAQTTHSVASTSDWNSTVSSLTANDIIQLTADITMDQDNMPSVACKICGQGYTLTGINDAEQSKVVFNLKAPITFVNTKFSGDRFFANGYDVKFEGSDNNLSSVVLYGGSPTDAVAATNVVIEGGTFGTVYAGGREGSVTGECKLTIQGGTFSGDLFGGCYNATSGSTDVNISGGSFQYINGGGYLGDVTGLCYLKISGNPTIVGSVFGGSNQKETTVGSTHVEISGGTFKDPNLQTAGGTIFAGGWGCTVTGNTYLKATGGTIGSLYGGCSQGAVNGSTYVEMDGATMDGGALDGGTLNSASIWGGGFGDDYSDDGYDKNNGIVGSTKVVVKSMTSGTGGVFVYGGGYYAGVTGNTDVTIEGGTILNVYGSSYTTEGTEESQYQGIIGGDVNIFVTGGEIEMLRAARGQAKDKPVPVVGTMNLTIEGGKITRQIASGNYPEGSGYKPCTLTIRNQGSEDEPFLFPETCAISNIVLEGTTVAGFMEPKKGDDYTILHSLIVNEDCPSEFSGDGKLKGDILLSNFKTSTEFANNKALVIADEQLKEASLAYENGTTQNADGTVSIKTTPIYKAGSTYRSGKNDSETTTLRTVNITHPANGKISAVWDKVGERNTVLEDGDQVPDNTTLTLSVVPDEGYQGGTITANGSELSATTYQVTADVIFTVTGLTAIPYTVTVAALTNGSISATPNADVTIGTPVNLTITPASGYRLKSGSLKVYKTSDENTTVTVSGNSFSMPAYDVTVTAIFEEIPYVPEPEPEPTVFYTVSIPSVEGITTDPVAGDYEVEAWDSFRFYLTLDKDYDQSEPIVTTDRGETLVPRTSDGAYVVKYVRSDVEISIDGIVKNPDPVANAKIESGVKVWTSNHRLFIHTDKAEDVFIYTFGGELRKTFRSAGGEEQVPLSSGSYIIRIGEDDFKVIL